MYRKERKDRNNEKDRSKKLREDVPEEEHERLRYSTNRPNRPSGNQRTSGFRHEQTDVRGLHGEHERWSGSGVPRDRFPTEHKRDRFDYQRPPGYHRGDHLRPDKRYVLTFC